MKKVLALLMVLALLIPTAAPAFAACSHPKSAIETGYGKMDVLTKVLDSERHRITIIFGEYKYCTSCGKTVSDWKEIEREVEEGEHLFDGEGTCWLCSYKPGSLKPEKVVLDKSGTVMLPMGETLALDYVLEPNGASAEVKWSTSSKKVATVDANGIVTPVKEGTATITVTTENGKKDTVKVKVVDPYKPSKIELNESGTVTLKMGETLELGYKLQPETARTQVKWTSSSKKVAAVDANGVVTPAKEGTATITVKTANGKKDTVKVKVIDPYKPSKVVLDQDKTVTVEIGKTLQLNAALQPETAKTVLKWSSSSKKIATVDENGLVTPVKKGTATITVKTANGKKDTVKIKVIGGENDYIELTKYLRWTPAKMGKALKCKYYKGGIDYAGHYANDYISIAGDDYGFGILKPSNYSIYGIYVGMDKETAIQKLREKGFAVEYYDWGEIVVDCRFYLEDRNWYHSTVNMEIEVDSKGLITTIWLYKGCGD